MRILAICTTYPPLRGGSETHCRLLYEGIAARGHEVTLITHAHSSHLPPRETLNGVTILRTKEFVAKILLPNRVPWEEAFFGVLVEVKHLLGAQTFDVIHTQNQAALILGAYLKSHWNCPLIASFHETCPDDDPFGESRSRAIIGNLPIDMVIAGSSYFQEQAIRFGVPREKTAVVYSGIAHRDPPENIDRSAVRANFGLSTDRFVLTAVGRYKPRKRQLDLIKAARELATQNIPFHLCLVGSCNSACSDYLKEIQHVASAEDLKHRISVLNDISDNDLRSLLWASDAGALVSEHEGLGLAILEYMSADLPVIASNIPGITEIIQQEYNGLLIKVSEYREIVNAVHRLINDLALRQRLIINGRITLQKFCIDNLVSNTLNSYQNLINNQSRGPRSRFL